MLLVVTGGRDFKNVEYIYAQLDKLHMQRRITTLRHGDADGVDRICAHWAERNGIKTEAFQPRGTIFPYQIPRYGITPRVLIMHKQALTETN